MTAATFSNNRLIRALRRESVDRTPIWIMRQAGRYLPEYRATREKAGSFVNLCRTPELACEVTLQPLERYELDAAIIFSDILVIPDAMGLGLELVESVGPVFQRPIAAVSDISRLRAPDPLDELGYVMDAVRLTAQSLGGKVPLIGFCGSPWTLAVYMIEGRSKTNFDKIRSFARQHPGPLQGMLEMLAESAAAYLIAKAHAGASALMIFDTWGGLLDTGQYLTFSLPYMQHIVNAVAESLPDMPVILFTKNAGDWLDSMAATGCSAIGVDWNIDLGQAREAVGGQVALQGNLNPATLQLSEQTIITQASEVLASFGFGSGHVFNLGHGITPNIDPGKVKLLVDTVHELSVEYH